MPLKKDPKNKVSRPEQLKDLIVDSIQEKKGDEIVILDLRNIEDRVCDFFIVCHAQSSTQVRSISNFIMQHVEDEIGEKAFKHEGMENLEWVIIDYSNVVVHVFQQDKRAYYKLEDLWADAKETRIKATL